jgi:bacteriocin-like protein
MTAPKQPSVTPAPSEKPKTDKPLSEAELDQISGGTTSNAMKARHDAATNAISNIR